MPVRAVVLICFVMLFILGFFLNRNLDLKDTLSLDEIEAMDGTEIDGETMDELALQINVQEIFEEDENEYLLELINGHEIRVKVAA